MLFGIESEYPLDKFLNDNSIKFEEIIPKHYKLMPGTTIEIVQFIKDKLGANVYSRDGNIVLEVKVPFEMWMIAVDLEIQKRTGLTSSDLPDYCWHDEYKSDSEPSESADIFLEDLQDGLI